MIDKKMILIYGVAKSCYGYHKRETSLLVDLETYKEYKDVFDNLKMYEPYLDGKHSESEYELEYIDINDLNDFAVNIEKIIGIDSETIIECICGDVDYNYDIINSIKNFHKDIANRIHKQTVYKFDEKTIKVT